MSEQKQRRILISGSTGLIGKHVAAARRALGDEVVPLVRHGGPPDAIRWREDGTLDPDAVSGFDAVIHLAGEPVATGRWTEAKKRRIRVSRVQGTQSLVSALRAATCPPKLLVCASGINFYGDCGDEPLDETHPAGQGFLAEVCVAWEAAAEGLSDVARVSTLRLGAVLSPEGGTLAAMLPLFRWGLAGPIAGGRPFVSWIALDDVLRAINFVIDTPSLHGPLNVVAPEPVRGREFTKIIAAAVGKPAVIPVPAWLARLMLGEMANETVLASVRVEPRRLLDAGFRFEFPDLHSAVAACLQRDRQDQPLH